MSQEVTGTEAVEANQDLETLDIESIVARHVGEAEVEPEEPVEAQDAAEEEQPPVDEKAEEPVEEPSDEVPLSHRARLIAAQTKKEQELQAKERRLKDLEQELGARGQSVDALLDTLARNPHEFIAKHREKLEKLGVKDPADLAARLYAVELGDDAPEQLKEQLRDARLRALEEQSRFDPEEIARKARAEAVQEIKVQVLDEQLQEFAADVPADKFPHLARLAQDSSEEVYEALVESAAAAIGQGRWLNASAIARSIEAELATLASKLGVSAKSAASNETQDDQGDETQVEPNALSDADAARRTPKRKKKPVEEMTEDEIEREMVRMLMSD